MKEKIENIKNNKAKKTEFATYVIQCAEKVGLTDSEDIEKSLEIWKLFSTVFGMGQQLVSNNSDLKILQDACQADFQTIQDIANHIKYLRQEVFMKGIAK